MLTCLTHGDDCAGLFGDCIQHITIDLPEDDE
jgi:hypothetical protein